MQKSEMKNEFEVSINRLGFIKHEIAEVEKQLKRELEKLKRLIN